MHGWLERARPRVCVLTDGSGRSNASRLDLTRRVLACVGAQSGSIFGPLSDRAIYAAMLESDLALFQRLVEELAQELRDADYVVGDAAEGYNPAHDLCRLLIDAAVERARRNQHRAVGNFAFSLVGPPQRQAGSDPRTLTLQLTDDALARKLDTARDYGALAGEVNEALRDHGAAGFRVEMFEQVVAGAFPATSEPPFYERHGAQRVAEGYYKRVLRQREHILPIARALGVGVRA